MSKFLKLVEESTPNEGRGPFKVEYKDVDGNLMATATIPDNVSSSYENFIKFVEMSNGKLHVVDNAPPVEDAENMKDSIKAITAIASLPDQSLGGQLVSSTSRKLGMAKRKMAKAALNIAKSFEKASQSS